MAKRFYYVRARLRATRHVLAALLLLLVAPRVKADTVTHYTEPSVFDPLYGPFDVLLNFRTSKDGTDHFDYSSWKDRPGAYFSDEVNFFSPAHADPNQVLWGHFDGDDGGIAPRPSFTGPLRLTFRLPVDAVGFRNRGMQPGIDVRYYGQDGTLLGAVLGTAVSFVGASSTEPIKSLIIEGVAGSSHAITALRFNQVVVVPTNGTTWGRLKHLYR